MGPATPVTVIPETSWTIVTPSVMQWTKPSLNLTMDKNVEIACRRIVPSSFSVRDKGP
ncbi:MAG: hypothetical protein NTV68_07530 [Methanomicrobiales archaeon]|nr:hypothetical protein [Methanomicrobiales archaeon]